MDPIWAESRPAKRRRAACSRVRAVQAAIVIAAPRDTKSGAGDRGWMIVDEQNQFVTLRTLPQLAEIKTALHGPYLHLYAGTNKILIDPVLHLHLILINFYILFLI